MVDDAALRLIPAVSLKGGAVVIVRAGAYEPVEDESGEPFSVDEFTEVFLKEFPAVLVFDIDGLEGEGAQYDEVARLEGAGPEVWWDAGARREEDVINLITSGADRAVLATRTLASLRELERSVEVTENIVFEVVLRGGVVQGASRDFAGKSVAEAAGGAAGVGAEEILLLDADRPLGGSVDWGALREAGPGWKAAYVGGGLDLATARALRPPSGIPLRGAVVDLIAVLAPYLGGGVA